MDLTKQLETISKFGYGVYRIPEGFAIADPVDDAEGFYIHGPSLTELCEEMLTNGPLGAIELQEVF